MNEKEEVNVFLNYEKIKENMSNIAKLEKRIKDIEPNNANHILYEQWVDKLTDYVNRIEKLEQILFLDREIAEKECAETIIELIISQCDSNKDQAENTWDKLVKIHKRQVRDWEVIWKFIEYKNEWIKDVFLHDIDKYVLTRAQKWHLVAQHIHNKKLLERLDGDPKIIRGILPEDQEEAKPHVYEMRVKDGDSETLKKIKKLAQEEQEFYNKHRYYSFWSDKLKAQRIKDGEKEPTDIAGSARQTEKEDIDFYSQYKPIMIKEIDDYLEEKGFIKVLKADLEQYKKGFKEIKKEVKFINEGVQEWFLETLSGLIQNVEKYLEDKENG